MRRSGSEKFFAAWCGARRFDGEARKNVRKFDFNSVDGIGQTTVKSGARQQAKILARMLMYAEMEAGEINSSATVAAIQAALAALKRDYGFSDGEILQGELQGVN